MNKSSTLKKIRPLHLAALIFFTVSGGPYGLEPLLTHAGEHGALLLVIVTPLLWDLPAILTVLELNGMKPVTGGYYKWVKHALGNRFGFYEGIWTWFYTFVDLAIYPVLFVQYISFFYPGLEAYKIPICLLIIWSSAGLNIMGIVPVGKVSLILSAIVIMPFAALFFTFLYKHTGPIDIPAPSLSHLTFSSIGLGMYTVMWNCLGWDSVTTYAEEVENPVRSYFVSIIVAFITVILVYVSVIVVAQQSRINYEVLTKQGFPALGTLISPWLGMLIASGGMAGTIGLYNANLLSVSRLPKAMADDEMLPTSLGRIHPRFNTPYVSILACSAIISLMVLFTFADLLIIDVTIYGAGLLLEYISLIRLRQKEPHTHRPFRIPLGIPGLCLFMLLPFGTYFIALSGVCSSSAEVLKPALFAIVILFSAELGWRIVAAAKPHLKDHHKTAL